ncbi:Hypothetical protein GLP15_4195 [Giardia lamblia P15]|uniref:Uncharacterized protein n=1 Tax=Giardia intestinalis (strain P15) TaxID=658858 RepID=E1F0J4_GIAIA|nr:Hypothetical protein GLP15_4195 [Giardia lamblia P15]
MTSEAEPLYIRALEQLMTPTDRSLMCQDADPQVVAQFLLGTYFATHITAWSPGDAHLEDRYDPQEPVTIRLISSLLTPSIPYNLVKMTAISPNKSVNISILCNHSIILHSDLALIIPPWKTKISISAVNTERFYHKLFKMRPRNARLHGASFRCPVISPEDDIIACSVSDYGDICIIHETGEVAILDHVELLPGRPYTYFFTSPFGMLSYRGEAKTQTDPYVVAYDCCFPPDSDNYLQCDSTLIVVRAIGRHAELSLERCIYSCSPCTIDDLALRGGVRRAWTLRQMPTITFRVAFAPTAPLSLSCFISPFGAFAVLVYGGLHFSIPILHINNPVRHVRQLTWNWSPVNHFMGARQRQDIHTPHGCRGCSSASLELDPKSERLPSISNIPNINTSTVVEKKASTEPVPIPCRCNCLQLMPSFDTYFSNLLNNYVQWLETDNGSYVMTHNLHAIIQAYMPHLLRSCSLDPVRISWSLDGAIYCMSYAGVFIFGTIFGVLFRVDLKDITSAAIAGGPMISFATSSNSLVGKDISFEFLGGRFLAFRFAQKLTIFQIVLPFNKLTIEYPERWALSTHTISACQLIRETPPVSVPHINLDKNNSYMATPKFIPQINAISFLSYTLENYRLLKQLLLSSSPLEAKELQEGLNDELNPNQSSDSMRELGIATEVLLFFQALAAQVGVTVKKMFDLIATLADHQKTTSYDCHLAKIASGAYSAIGSHACEAVLVPLNILRRRYTKELSSISLVSAEQTYMIIVDSIASSFDDNVLSFFYKQLSNYPMLFSSRSSDSLNISGESSDIFTRDSDDAEDTSKPGISTEDALKYTKTVCVMAISLLKFTALFVRTSYSLIAARTHLLAPSQPHQLPYKNNGSIGYTIPASTCLFLACGYCCLACDTCVYHALCSETKDPTYKELVQKAAFFLLCIHVLAKQLQFYFLDSVVVQMLSILVPQNYTSSSRTFNKPKNVAVPLLPIYIINAYFPSLEPFSTLQSSSLTLEKRFAGVSEGGHSHFIPESIVCSYGYLFSGTSIYKLDASNSPYNRLYLQSVLNVLRDYNPFQSHDVGYRMTAHKPPVVPQESSTPTHAQILYAAYVAGKAGRFLAVVSYLLKLSGDSDYCGPSPCFSDIAIQTTSSTASLTELQRSVLTRVLTLCDTVKNRSPLAHADIDFLLTLRARADTALLDSLTFFLLYITAYNMLPDFNYFLTFQRNVYTEPRCHCSSSPATYLDSFSIAGRARYSLTFPNTAYIDNLLPTIQPLFTPLCVALFLLAIGRLEDGIFLLAREGYYSVAIHLLRCFLTSFSAISSKVPETVTCSKGASLIDQSSVDENEKCRIMNVYACKMSNLERLCSELETNQSALSRMCGPQRESIKEINYYTLPEQVSEVLQPKTSGSTFRTTHKKPKQSVTKSHSTPLEIETPLVSEEHFLDIDDFHVNKNPEIGEILSTSAVKIDDVAIENHIPPGLDLTVPTSESQHSSVLVNPLQNTKSLPPPPPPLPPSSIPLSQQPSQPPPLPPPPGSAATLASVPISAPVQPFPFYPQPSSVKIPPSTHYGRNGVNNLPPNPEHFFASNVNRPGPAYSLRPQPSRPVSSRSTQRPLSILTTSQIRPHSAYLPMAPGPSAIPLPVHVPITNVPSYFNISLPTHHPHIPERQPVVPHFQPYGGNLNLPNCPTTQMASVPQVPLPFQQQFYAQSKPQHVEKQEQLLAPTSQASSSKPESQRQKRMQPQIQSIEISSMTNGSTLSINDPYPPQQPVNYQMCSNLELEDNTPPIFSSGISTSGVDLGTQDYKNMAQYLHAAAPKYPEVLAKRKPHSDIRWMDISKNIEEIDQLTAAAQGTMNYLQALTKEVEGNEQRLLRAKH